MQADAMAVPGGGEPQPGRGVMRSDIPEPADRRWRGPAPGDLLWLESDAEAVVFDRRSAQTHLLNPHAAAALRILMQEPTDAAGLGRQLAQLAGDDAAASLAKDILEVFDKLGLVEPAGL